MIDFTYHNPTKIHFGRSALDHLGEELGALGAECVLILYGGSFARESGLLGDIEQAVRSAGALPLSQGGVCANPRTSLVDEYGARYAGKGIDAVLAVGGGSVIDVAKALALVLANEGLSADRLILGEADPRACLPIGVVLTLAGSGSESSCSLVLTVDDGMLKRSFDGEIIRPRFALLDPTLTFSLPKEQMVAGACDILMHAMERYFSPTDATALIDRMAEGLMASVIDALRASILDPCDYEARATLMWAGSLAHNDLLGTGRVEDWACHRMEHEVSGLFDVTHGAGLCAIWGSWARYVQPRHPGRFAEFARRVMGVDERDEDRCGKRGIEALVGFFREVGMPTSLADIPEVTLTEDVIARMAANCTLRSPTIGGLERLGSRDIVAIYRKAGEIDE